MRAAVMRDGRIEVDEVPEPIPGPGEVLVETIACGICGSDLHALVHGREMVETARESGNMALVYDPDRDLVMGHEFSARVLDLGADVDGVSPGDEVACMPGHRAPDGRIAAVGYDNDYPGGYGERMVLGRRSLLPLPNGLDPRHAALTEPMAVGLHAVNASSVGPDRSAVVIGAGPVGLSVIAALKARGIGPVVAADFSPTRRALAEALGADEVVDPRVTAPVDAWKGLRAGRNLVLFEAVGVQGMIDGAMRAAPRGSEIVVAGVCMQEDRIFPTMGINKELALRFVLGWTPAEFEESLRSIAEGRIDVGPLITGEVGVDGVADAFVAALADPEQHAKIVVRPGESISGIRSLR